MPSGTNLSFHCSVGCSQCPSSKAYDETSMPALTGKSMVLAAFSTFLLPLVLALAGAVLGSSDPSLQLGGGIAGLALGMIVARRLAHRSKPSQTPEQ